MIQAQRFCDFLAVDEEVALVLDMVEQQQDAVEAVGAKKTQNRFTVNVNVGVEVEDVEEMLAR